MVAEANNINKLGLIANKNQVAAKKADRFEHPSYEDSVTISDEAKEGQTPFSIEDLGFSVNTSFSQIDLLIGQLNLLANCCNEINAALDQAHEADEEAVEEEDEEREYMKELEKKLERTRTDVQQIAKQVQDAVAMMASASLNPETAQSKVAAAADVIMRLQSSINSALSSLGKLVAGIQSSKGKTDPVQMDSIQASKGSLERSLLQLNTVYKALQEKIRSTPGKSLNIFI